MKLNIKLKDSKQCWGCPCLIGTTIYPGETQDRDVECSYKKSYKPKYLNYYEYSEILRPKKCIKDNEL